MRRHLIHRRAGYVMFLVLFFVSIATLMTSVLLGRSSTELQAANRFVDSQRAFHVAEAGIDEALREFELPVEGFSEEDGWTTGPPCPADSVCRTNRLGEGEITVANPAGDLSTIDAVGVHRGVARRLGVVVQKHDGLPVRGTATVIGEGGAEFGPDFFNGSPDNTIVNGCDVANPGECLHGLIVTTQQEYDNFVAYVNTHEPSEGYFGDRLVGAVSDWQGGVLPTDYSVHYAPQDVDNGGLGYAVMKSLAEFAKTSAQASGCYFDMANDDEPGNDPLKGIKLKNRTFGTLADPKICYVDAPLGVNADGTYVYPDDSVAEDKREEVHFTGRIEGTGVLVVHGEVDATSSGTFIYQGLIVSVGPSGEIEFRGHSDVRGAILISTTDPSTDADGTVRWCRTELAPEGTGLLQYDSVAVAMAKSLLSSWTSPSISTIGPVSVVLWQERVPGQDP